MSAFWLFFITRGMSSKRSTGHNGPLPEEEFFILSWVIFSEAPLWESFPHFSSYNLDKIVVGRIDVRFFVKQY